MPAGEERMQGDREKSAAVRDGLIDILQESPAVQVVAPALVEHGNPSFMLATSDGMFVVSVQKVSSVTSERIGPINGN